jgi:hypothetical protein
MITSAVFSGTMTVNTMLYLIPVAQDEWWDSKAGLTVVFKVLLPCVLTSITLIGIRVWPAMFIMPHLAASQGFDSLPGGARMVMESPMAVMGV